MSLSAPDGLELVADRLVDRFVRFGYNTICVHHHDGAWAKAFAARQQADNNKDGCGDSGARLPSFVDDIDRLDYLLAKCFERGIYVTTDLYVSRSIKWREIVPAKLENGVLRFRVCTAGPEGGRIYYEIVR